MADIFSNLYLAVSVNYYHDKYKASPILTNHIIDNLINENQQKINNIINNMSYDKYLVSHLKKKIKPRNYNNELNIFNEIMNNENIMNEIKKNIFYENTIIHDMENINNIEDNNNVIVDNLKQEIINVEEYKNI